MSTLSTTPLDSIHYQLSSPPPPVIVPEVYRPATPAQLERFLNVAAFDQLSLAQKSAIKRDYLEGCARVAFSDSLDCTAREITHLVGIRTVMARGDLRRLGFRDLPAIEKVYTLSFPHSTANDLRELKRSFLDDCQPDLTARRMVLLGGNKDLEISLPGNPLTHFTITIPTNHPGYCIVHCSGAVDQIIVSDLRGSLGIQRLSTNAAPRATGVLNPHEIRGDSTVSDSTVSAEATALLSKYFKSPAPGLIERLQGYLSKRA